MYPKWQKALQILERTHVQVFSDLNVIPHLLFLAKNIKHHPCLIFNSQFCRLFYELLVCFPFEVEIFYSSQTICNMGQSPNYGRNSNILIPITWRKKNQFRQARLDFFLFTESMLTNIENCTIDPSYRSNHSMIILSLVFNPFNKGKGLWKFNNSLLYEKDYSKIVREKIIDLKKQYATLIYNKDKIQEIDDNELQLTINCFWKCYF